MSSPLVSIAVCTYNGEKYLVEQLDSIVNQSYQTLEIIVVDDQSSDNTPGILKSYADKYPIFKIYENKVNLGYVKNFEKAISLCSGEYISLSDQDDIWNLNKIEQQIQFIKDNVMVYHDSEIVDESGKSLNKKMTDFRNFYSGDDSRFFLLENCVSGHSIFFKRQLVEHLLPFPKEIFHDWWIAFVSTNQGKISFQPETFVQYRQHNHTSTDILRNKKTSHRKRLDRVSHLIEKVNIFYEYPTDKHHQFTENLLKLFKLNTYALPLFVWKHRALLLFMQKKNIWSKFNFCRKLKI